MRAQIIKAETCQEFATPERCLIVEIGNDEGDQRVSIARARVEPGVTTAWHSLEGIDERYIVIAGRGRVEIGDLDAVEVEPGDVVRIPAGLRQRIANIGSGDLVFYAVCSPRFRKDRYRNLE